MDILKQFGVEPLLLIAQIVNFAILFLLLRKFLYGPILKVLEQRKNRIAQSLKNADEIEKKLLKTEEDREKKLEAATKESTKIVNEAASSAKQIIEEAHQKASDDITLMVKKAEESLKLERERLHQEIRQELSEIVATSLERITGKVLTDNDKKTLISESVKKV